MNKKSTGVGDWLRAKRGRWNEFLGEGLAQLKDGGIWGIGGESSGRDGVSDMDCGGEEGVLERVHLHVKDSGVHGCM